MLLSSPAKRRRFGFCLVMAALVGGGATLVLKAFRDTIVYYYTPSDVHRRGAQIPKGRPIRIGGQVVSGSVRYGPVGEGASSSAPPRGTGARRIDFILTDGRHQTAITYQGVLPDLFREGQGIVAEGPYQGPDHLIATIILAKHDETYRPPDCRS